MFKSGTVAKTAVAVLVAVGGIALVAFAGGTPDSATYIGSKKCKLCHFKEHKTWSKTKHAKNFDILLESEQKDPDCLKCHTTGYGKPGGFVSLEKTPHMKSTGCESCHGPGSAHAEVAKDAPESGEWDKKTNKVPQNTCVACHNPHVNQKERVEKLRKGS